MDRLIAKISVVTIVHQGVELRYVFIRCFPAQLVASIKARSFEYHISTDAEVAVKLGKDCVVLAPLVFLDARRCEDGLRLLSDAVEERTDLSFV